MTQPVRPAPAHGRAAVTRAEATGPGPRDTATADGARPVPLAGLALPGAVRRAPAGGPARDALAGLRGSAGTVRRTPEAAGLVIRRSPQPSSTEGEFVDPAAPGFVFVPTGRPNEYRVKGSDLVVSWDEPAGHWVNADGLVVQFEDLATGRPSAGLTPEVDLRDGLPLPAVSTLPPLKVPKPKGGEKDNPEWLHFPMTMQDFKQLGVYDQMMMLADLASKFPVTPYELFLQQQAPEDRPSRFYRYHKFSLNLDDPAYVLGGGLNKVEITEEWRDRNLRKLIADRYKLLNSLMRGAPRTVKAMEEFQANAMSTPFIATTGDRGYAESLYREYPPGKGQRAVLLVIEGPKSRVFDFEEIYQTIKGAGGGRAEWNWRTSAKRAKDADQAEFGLPDLYIPLRGVSPLGFRVVEIVELSMPPEPELPLLTQDARMQVLRARQLPKHSELAAHGHPHAPEDEAQ
ncbi:MAG TPA: hypothetical protein VMB79_18580 [Jatrophihabitans sp.]|nr:hypothetical protein [Jatrophihabitans sp.]